MTGFDLELPVVGRLVLASLLGALIGLEREIHGRPAGFRTHLLVSLGSCLFVVTSIQFYKDFGNFSGQGPIGVDPGRVAAQVVTGIGFLGAGAIMRDKASIRGLTTAACLWIAAAIGLACGVGMYAVSFVVTLLALLSLLLLKKVENILSRDTYLSVKVWSEDRLGLTEEIESLLNACQIHVITTSITKNLEKGELVLYFQVRYNSRKLACDLVDQVCAVTGVKRVALG